MEDDEEKMQKRMESSFSSSTSAVTGEMEYGSAASGKVLYFFQLNLLISNIYGF